MSQNTKKTQGGTADVQDYDLENQSGANFRTELNNIIYDASSNYSGDTEPKGPHVAIGMLWMDTSVSPDVLKVCTSTSGSGNTMTGGFVAVSTDTTANQTITLSGDASGSGTTAITVTVANDSHTHGASNITTGQINASFLSSDIPVLGEVLTATSGTAASWQAAAAGGTIGGLLLHQMTNGSGMFTVPEGVTRLIVTGAGGGGTGVRRSEGQASGGGGAGGCCVRTQVTVTAGATIDWTVGAGVAGSTSGSFGNNGNATTVTGGGVSITLGGGGRSNLANGGGGGSASVTGGAANTVFGGTGGVSVSQGAGGGGGSNFWGPFGSLLSGPGDPRSSATVNGGVGVGPGGGGGGGVNGIASSRAGALIIEVGVA